MAYTTAADCLAKLSEHGAAAYLDDDGDGVLNSAEKQRITDAIAYADKVIDGKLTAAGLKVKTAGVVIKEASIWLALAQACVRKGNEAAWIGAQAKAQLDVIDMIARGKLRVDDEVTTVSKAPRTRVSDPIVKPGEGVDWS